VANFYPITEIGLDRYLKNLSSVRSRDRDNADVRPLFYHEGYVLRRCSDMIIFVSSGSASGLEGDFLDRRTRNSDARRTSSLVPVVRLPKKIRWRKTGC